VFRPRETDNLREKHNIKDEKIIVHVTPNFEDPCKGGRFVLDLARRLKDENAKIIVVGVKKPIENCPENLIAINRTENQARLAEYYSLGDVFLITSEMECLPTVCLEALCCGTPVLGFEAGGTSETAPAPYGVFVPHGDMEELEKAARDILSGETALAAQAECAEFGRRQYGKSGMTQRYLEIYNAILGKDSDERL
jgi:glycosyltransferase involved in cell wall biosynthesis